MLRGEQNIWAMADQLLFSRELLWAYGTESIEWRTTSHHMTVMVTLVIILCPMCAGILSIKYQFYDG